MRYRTLFSISLRQFRILMILLYAIIVFLLIAILAVCAILLSVSRRLTLLEKKISADMPDKTEEALPAPAETTAEESADSSLNIITEPQQEAIHILLVNDNAESVSSLAEALSPDYEVTCSSSAEEALSLIGANSFDAVISDIDMPDMSGFELCRNIKSNIETSHIPVMLLSALRDNETIISALEAGAEDCMLKPCDITILRMRLKTYVSEMQKMRRSIVTHLASHNEPEKEDYSNRYDHEFITSVTAILEENLSNSDFMIGDLCSSMGMSRTALFNKLKSLTGLPPNDFIRTYRLNKADKLLRSHEHNVSEVAYMVGFSDPKYFSVCFKKQFGTSPSKL